MIWRNRESHEVVLGKYLERLRGTLVRLVTGGVACYSAVSQVSWLEIDIKSGSKDFVSYLPT